MLTYNVFDDVLQLRDIVDSFFTGSSIRNRQVGYPYVELHEGNDEVKIRALVPGLKSEDVNLELVDNSLVIEGDKKSDYTEDAYIRKERTFGSFKRSIKLPYRVDGNDIKAEMKNGILEVTLKKSEDAKPRRIEIQ